MSNQETNKISVLAGTCPDEVCQSIVVFKPVDQYVLCQRCGQTHEKKRILDVFVIQENSLGMKNVLRSLILATNPNLKKATDTVKVNGLSNYHCKLLSPLFTEYGMDKLTLKAKPLSEITNNPTFDCSLLKERCFTICREHLNIPGFGRDSSGSDLYLSETLKNIEEANGNKEVLVPLHADGDGHCLVHAISRALTGLNLFWHPLRSHLKRHIIEKRETYQMLLADFINASEWDDIIKECDPKYEPDELKGEVLGLRNVHIFGLANVLKRPIILFDSLAGMKSSGDYSAVFLPSLVEPQECKTKSGELIPPICIAWSNAGRGHFIPLVGIRNENPPAIPISMLPEVWAVSHSLMSSYIQFSPDGTILITGKLLQEAYIQKLVKCMNELFLQKNGVHPLLVCDKYQFICSNPVTSDVTPEAITNETRRAAQDHRLYRCIDCLALNMSPILAEWLRPGNNGVIYNQAISKYGFLSEGCKYIFAEYSAVCIYDAKKDVLIVQSVASQKCTCCLSTRVRMVHVDGTIAYENGDITPLRSSSKYCTCGYKHFYGGKEYDNPPDMITVCMNWSGQTVFEDIAWFQFESDVSLNSNVFQLANSVVQKHFPGEFGTDGLVRQVVEQLLAASKRIDERRGQNESSLMLSMLMPAKEEQVKSALQISDEVSTKCESPPMVTAVIKLPEEAVVQNDADSSVMSNLQELTNETETLVLEQEDKYMYMESENDGAMNTSEDVTHFSFEDDLRQVRLDFQAQQNEYKMKKIRESSARSSREKFLDLLSNPDYDALVNYGPNAVNHNSVWDVVSAASNGSSDSGHGSFHQVKQPATTVRVGPGYSVLAPRSGDTRLRAPISSRGSRTMHGIPVNFWEVPDDYTLQEDLSRSENSSEMEEVKDNYNYSCRGLARSRVRGTTSARARSRPKRRD